MIQAMTILEFLDRHIVFTVLLGLIAAAFSFTVLLSVVALTVRWMDGFGDE